MALSTLKDENVISMVHDIHAAMREKERRRPRPLPTGHYRFRYREIASYTIRLCEDLKLSTATTCRVFALMSRVFTGKRLNAPQQEAYFQLVVLVCVSIAAKYEETPENQPLMSELLDAADGEYSAKEFQDMERFVLDFLHWQVSDITPACFGSFYLGATTMGDPDLDEQVKTLFTILLGLSLQDANFVRYLPSVLSASALKLARTIVKQQEGHAGEDDWGVEMVDLTKYSATELRPCATHLWDQYVSFLNEGAFGHPSANASCTA